MPMKTRRLFAMVVVGVLAFAAWSCKPENEEVENVTVNPSEARIEVGGTYQLTAVVMPLDAPKEFQWTSSNSSVATVSGTGLVTAVAIGECNITVTAGDKNDVCKVTVVERGGNQSLDGFNSDGASNALFSVGESSRVRFSRGNLQYQASTGTWRFAMTQYDFVTDNNNISESYSGWIDLFGWGTSGWNSGASNYQPWCSGVMSGDYGPGENNLTGTYANADWGVNNAIANGGNRAGMWRTLTKDEWNYLLFSRNTDNTLGSDAVRFVKATINARAGLVIFPDNYTHPSSLAAPTGMNESNSSYSANAYTYEQWSLLQDAGCVFLPAVGYRLGTEVNSVAADGAYWSSTYTNSTGAWGLAFVDSYRAEMIGCVRGRGQSVRLVMDAD